MLRMKVSLLLAACSVAFAGCTASSTTDSASSGVPNPNPLDTTPPSRPMGLTGSAVGSTGAKLSWSASTDNIGVTGYIVHRNGAQVAAVTTRNYADGGLSAATTYTYSVAARDAAGNISPDSASVNVTTASTSVTLAWDAVAAPTLSGYRVYFGTAAGGYLQPRGQGVAVGDVTTYTVAGLSGGSRYFFAVTAFDTLGFESGFSNEVFKDIP
jgi:cellulose 1,4-beta-cellobiosidase